MPRQARLDVPGALHHIMVLGINRSAIFEDDQNRTRFLERLGETITDAAANSSQAFLKRLRRSKCVSSKSDEAG